VAVVRLMGSLFRTQSLIFKRVDPRAYIYCLKVRSLKKYEFPPYALDKGVGVESIKDFKR
jgi:hypothetical protein